MRLRDSFVWRVGFIWVLGWGLGGSAVTATAQSAEKSNMELVGSNDLQGRSAYQPTIHKQGERWIAYIGHHAGTQLNSLTGKQESNGTSIVEVTDPKHPKYLAHIPGAPHLPGLWWAAVIVEPECRPG